MVQLYHNSTLLNQEFQNRKSHQIRKDQLQTIVQPQTRAAIPTPSLLGIWKPHIHTTGIQRTDLCRTQTLAYRPPKYVILFFNSYPCGPDVSKLCYLQHQWQLHLYSEIYLQGPLTITSYTWQPSVRPDAIRKIYEKRAQQKICKQFRPNQSTLHKVTGLQSQMS